MLTCLIKIFQTLIIPSNQQRKIAAVHKNNFQRILKQRNILKNFYISQVFCFELLF